MNRKRAGTLPCWLTKELQPYRDVFRNGRTFEQIVGAELDGLPVESLRRLGFLVLRPEALRNGDAARILDWLESANGIVPLKLRVLKIAPGLFDALYRRKLELFGPNEWLHHGIFSQSPAAVVLLGGGPDAAPHLSAFLNRIKGRSEPGGSRVVEVRGRFSRLSSFHAVVHCAENPGALLYESTLFFAWSALRDVLTLAGHGAPGDAALRKAIRRPLLDLGTDRSRNSFSNAAEGEAADFFLAPLEVFGAVRSSDRDVVEALS